MVNADFGWAVPFSRETLWKLLKKDLSNLLPGSFGAGHAKLIYE